ncbi:MAG: putative DNA binding domain-containing protein [Lachnospiraceae bacterium]|nr:putative DNA binding domain-containing protein [Lachnospiraceae bacterium]
MNREFMQKLLDSGEGYTIEYKKNEQKLSSDVFETVGSFSNRYGGHILLGVIEVERDGRKVGQVTGVEKDSIYDMKRDFINILNNPTKFSPTLYLELEEFDYDGKTVLWTYVPPMSQLCYCNKKVFDRADDADQDVTNKNDRLAEIINRKSAEYRERQILPYANESHLKMELMNQVRKMVKGRDKNHPWKNMDDMEIMRSAGLYVDNMVTGEKGFNLAAILLFGKPEAIKSVVPGYMTDAIYRVENLDRYDDRDMVDVNLIEAYDRLMAFCLKHMDNRFVLDGDISVDARSLIVREVISNILIHRDYSNAFPAKLIIEKDVLRTENWSKSRFNGELDLNSFSPYPKNPLIASFFVNIGLADKLGSGMRNIYKYTRLYSHADPVLSEGDIFEIRIPLNSADVEIVKSDIEGEKSDIAIINSDIENTKSDIEARNSDIASTKSDIEVEKSDIAGMNSDSFEKKLPLNILLDKCKERSYKSVVVANIKEIYEKVGVNQVFGESDIETILGCVRSTASAIMKRLREMDVVVSVKGQGKGKYRFKNESEI